jgi:hypothetical protein
MYLGALSWRGLLTPGEELGIKPTVTAWMSWMTEEPQMSTPVCTPHLYVGWHEETIEHRRINEGIVGGKQDTAGNRDLWHQRGGAAARVVIIGITETAAWCGIKCVKGIEGETVW